MNFESWVKPHLQNGKGYIAYNFNTIFICILF